MKAFPSLYRISRSNRLNCAGKMKDLRVIWNTLSRCQIYSSVNINPNIEKQVEQDETRTLENLQRKSSVMLNKFFNTALPVDSDSRQNWSKSKYEEVSFQGRVVKTLFYSSQGQQPVRQSGIQGYINTTYIKITVRFLNTKFVLIFTEVNPRERISYNSYKLSLLLIIII